MRIYGKAVASIESTDDDKFGPNGGFTAVLSTPSEDRDGDRLMRQEWKEFTQERYPLDIDHGMSVADTVGSFVPYWDGDRMMMDAHFASTAKAQETRALTTPDPVTGIRHIGSVSVAFMTDKTKKSGEPRRELLNAGIVAIPSNRDAVILASKACSALKDALSDATEGDVPDEVKEAVLEALEAKSPKPYGDVTYADPQDGKYPIDTVAHIRAALAYINVQKNYDALGDHAAHVKATIEAAARAHGIEVSDSEKSVEDAETKDVESKGGTIYINVVPRLDEDALKRVLADVTKAAATASGVGGDGALVQAIHDASSHLGAACPVIEVTDEGSGADDGANKSADEAETKDLEAFEKSLDEIIPSDDSPAEAAAATDEVPAPAVEAADEKAKRGRAVQLAQMTAELIRS